MRSRTKKVTFVALLLALSLVVWAPATAPAQVPGFPSDLIIFTGAADIDSSDKTPTGDINWLDESGTYAFVQGPPVGCIGISVPDMVPENPLRDCVIASHPGTFQNLVCGTGTAHAGTEAAPILITETTNPLLSPPLPAETETIGVHYTVLFVATVGVLVADIQEPPPPNTPAARGEAFGVVRVSGIPTPPFTPDPDNDPNPGWGPCATGFNVVGAAVTYQGAF